MHVKLYFTISDAQKWKFLSENQNVNYRQTGLKTETENATF